MLTAAATAKSSIYARPSAPVRSNPFSEGPLGLMGVTMRFAGNIEIYGEDEPAEYFYQVISGAVRTYRMLDDGRRQVSAFHLPGDIFRYGGRRRASVIRGGDRRREDPGCQTQYRNGPCRA